jgi:endonuclease/exonuclease/phosphatase family metal-dependent hydrolase
MKLLQLNAWGGRLEPQIRELIKTQRPDIVCLQEVISFEGDRTGLFITIENIQKECGLPYVAFAPVFTFNLMDGKAQFGNCILSRNPITRTEIVFTHLEHKDDFVWDKDSSNMRNFVHAVVEINDIPTNVITHHGFWIPDHKKGNATTLEHMDVLADYISNLNGPVILTGDFNLEPSSESLKRLNESLTNLSVTHKLKTTRNNLTHKTETCDYVFVNDMVKTGDFEALDDIASDHKALVLEFDI